MRIISNILIALVGSVVFGIMEWMFLDMIIDSYSQGEYHWTGIAVIYGLFLLGIPIGICFLIWGKESPRELEI